MLTYCFFPPANTYVCVHYPAIELGHFTWILCNSLSLSKCHVYTKPIFFLQSLIYNAEPLLQDWTGWCDHGLHQGEEGYSCFFFFFLAGYLGGLIGLLCLSSQHLDNAVAQQRFVNQCMYVTPMLNYWVCTVFLNDKPKCQAVIWKQSPLCSVVHCKCVWLHLSWKRCSEIMHRLS